MADPNPAFLRPHLRRIYNSWRVGAGFATEDVMALVERAGLKISRNQAREFGRDSDRSAGITLEQLEALMKAWGDEQEAARKAATPPTSRREKLLADVGEIRRDWGSNKRLDRLLDVVEDMIRDPL